jgi:hypothetical protein
MAEYFRQTIKKYSHIAYPLVNLTKKKVAWRWGRRNSRSFMD